MPLVYKQLEHNLCSIRVRLLSHSWVNVNYTRAHEIQIPLLPTIANNSTRIQHWLCSVLLHNNDTHFINIEMTPDLK